MILMKIDDPDEEVRIQALSTLEELGELERSDLSRKLSDPSEGVRATIQKLLSRLDPL